MVYCYFDFSLITQEDFNQWKDFLPMERLTKMNHYVRYEDQLLCMVSYLIVRYSLYREHQLIEIVNFDQRKSKPQLMKHEDIHFNISHCSQGVACSLSTDENGIDIQKIDDYEIPYAMVLSPNEISLCNHINNSALEFVHFWTLKECYGKAIGKGILYDMPQKDFSTVHWNQWERFEDYLLYSFTFNSYVISICAKEKLEMSVVSYEQLTEFINLLK
jgi:4'-phosphopantetheinyl transferase